MNVRHAIFPVAGLGTRFLPATKALPKEMLPVVDKPLMQYAVEEAYAAGVREMIFVTSRHKRAIEDHFDRTFELEDALEKSRQGRAARRRSRRQARRHGVRLRPPAAGARPRPRRAVRSPPRRRPSVRRPPARRPDDRHAADPGADGRAVRGAPGIDRRGAGSARRAHAPLRHRRRTRRRRAADRHRADRREARARGRAVAPRRRRPLRADAARVRRDRAASRAASAARSSSPTASPACCSARRCSPTATTARRYDCGSKEGFLQANVELALEHPELGPGFRAYLRTLSL